MNYQNPTSLSCSKQVNGEWFNFVNYGGKSNIELLGNEIYMTGCPQFSPAYTQSVHRVNWMKIGAIETAIIKLSNLWLSSTIYT